MQTPNLKGDIQGDFNIAMIGLDKNRRGRIVTNSIGMKFVPVPHGTFLMGTADSSTEGFPSERPQHSVEITRDFYLGATEVTQGQYARVMGRNPSYFAPAGDGSGALPAGEDMGNLPVENVSYEDAVAFCGKLRSLDQPALGSYRLPTEAEWEYAARGGPLGSAAVAQNPLSGDAWFKANSNYRSHPVGGKAPNALGLYDMLGNVAEWCSDWYDEKFYARPEAGGHDPQGPSAAAVAGLHVIRGGSFATGESFCRPADRYAEKTTHRNNSLGFRVLLVPGASP
jgi:formylglycine-generating enzyme required for sulfatase activity